MITLNVLQLLEDNGFGNVMIDEYTSDPSLYFEKLPHDAVGVYIVARGTAILRGSRAVQAFDLYARGANDIEGATKLEAISDFFDSIYGTVCNLPIVPNLSETQYKNVVIQPTSSISNVGVDDSDRVIYSVSAQITYSK